jgi:hypothetical protein
VQRNACDLLGLAVWSATGQRNGIFYNLANGLCKIEEGSLGERLRLDILDPIYPQGATGETMTNRLIILRIGRTTKHDYTRLGEVSGGNREVPDTVTLSK